MAVELKKHKISREAYHLMAQSGILNEEDKVELLDGEIIQMSPVGTSHIGIVGWLTRYLTKKLPEETMTFVQSPISLGTYSEPEPDLVVCHFRNHYYRDIKIKPADILLLIEVSDTTLTKDREVKMPLYAEAGIQTYWIVNLIDRHVEVYTEPKENGFEQKRILYEYDKLALPEFRLEIPLREMFG